MRTQSDAIRDNLLDIAKRVGDVVNPHQCEEELTSIAAAIGNSTMINKNELQSALRMMNDVLWKMHFSEFCNAVMEGYSITVRDMLEQLALTLDIPITDKTESTETNP